MQPPIKVFRLNKRNKSEATQVGVLKSIDFSTAYKLCLEKLNDKPTVSQLKEWLTENEVELHPADFLTQMYKKGVQNEKN